MVGILSRIRRRFKRKKVTLQERYPQYDIGPYSYGDLKVVEWGEGKTLKVGAFCSISRSVKVFLGGEHRVDWVTTFPFTELWKQDAGYITGHPLSKGDVIIGNDVWIGSEAVILSGVRIGDGAVVGARAMVAQNVPPYAIVAGNPARVIRMRFEPQQIERLLALAWWDKDIALVKQWLPDLLNNDIDGFLHKAESAVNIAHR